MNSPRTVSAWVMAVALAALVSSVHCRTLSQAQAPSTVRWCMPAPSNAATLSACTAAISAANTATINFTCVAGTDEAGCVELVSSGGAELTTQGGASMLEANEAFSLEPLAAEFYGDIQGASYFSVAVVPASFCTANVTFASLKGKRSCHTGYGRTAGWTLPVGYLTGAGVIPIVNSDPQVKADAESVASFFTATCAAGTSASGPGLNGAADDAMCTACKGNCDSTDPYYDYPGAFRCVMENAGDVAFTKHTTALEYSADGTTPQAWSTKNKADFRLLCPTGGCAPLEDFDSCNIAKAPAYAVMSTAAFRSSATGRAVQQALQQAASDAAFLNVTRDFSGIENFFFSADTEGILPVNTPFIEYYGANTKQAYDGVAQLESAAPTPAAPTPATPTPTPSGQTPAPATNAPTVRWCIPYAANATLQSACQAAVANGNTAAVSFDCVMGGSQDTCLEMISTGAADLILLGGSEQLPAHQEFGLEPIAAEYYGDLQGASYYSVAVVPAEFCTEGVTLKDLRGKRSCHTGYRRTAGWTLPIGYLTQNNIIPRVDEQDNVQADAESVASFFSATCAAGGNADGPLLGGGKFDGMCTACKGNCDDADPYFDYAGSLRCMMEGAGDVSFNKHSTPLQYASDGTEPQEWSSMSKADMMLLCPAGGCAPLDQFESCNIAKSPARAVYARPEYRTNQLGADVKKALVDGGAELAEALTGIGGQNNLLLGPDAQSLLAVDVPFTQFFGASTQQAYEGITSLDAVAGQQGAAPAPSSGGSSGVSSGAAAGIGIGCAVAGALIGVVAMAVFAKKRAGWQPHADAGAAAIAGSRAPSDSWAAGKI